MQVRCLPASVQSARSVFEKNTHDLRAFHSTTDSTNLTDKICLEGNTERSESNPGRSLGTTDKRRAAVWKTVPANELSIISPSFLGVFTRMITRYRPCFVQFLTQIGH